MRVESEKNYTDGSTSWIFTVSDFELAVMSPAELALFFGGMKIAASALGLDVDDNS